MTGLMRRREINIRKLVILVKISEKYVEQLKKMAPDWEIICNESRDGYLKHLTDAEIISGWSKSIKSVFLYPGTQLRWIHSWGAGVDTIPVESLRDRGIILTNSSGVHSYPISETVIAMMLSLTRKLHMQMRYQINKEWKPEGSLLEMHGKTIGILGVGDIGIEVARLAKAFGMEVLGYRRSGKPLEGVDKMFEFGPKGLNELLRRSDYVVNTLPLTKETVKIIGKEQFEIMKPTAFYINIGRGRTTDEEALVNALCEGHIGGAGLDVFEKEPLPLESPLWELENVILTPHVSGSTEYYSRRVMDIFIANFIDYLDGKLPEKNRVDLDKGY